MTSLPSQPGDNKVTVKICSIEPNDDLSSRNFISNHNYSEMLEAKHRTNKRINSKLYITNEGLKLIKNSWWVQQSPYSKNSDLLPYENILRFSSVNNHPKRILIFITNENSKTALIVIKTKSENFANYLLKTLYKNVIEARQKEAAKSLPVNYRTDGNKVPTTPRKSSTDSSSISFQKRRPAPSPPSQNNSEPPVGKQTEKIIIPRTPDGFQQGVVPPPRSKKNSILSNGHNAEDYSHENVETLNTDVYYDENTDKRSKSATDGGKQRRTKSRTPTELSTLSSGRKTTRELDENNTPWEVNICYIKHDPLVGCVEDESGPIYMYTAHQLFVRDDRDYDNYDSEDSDDDTITDDNDSDSGSPTNNQDSFDENKELERFMMLGGENHAKSRTNGKMTEYKY